jgi:surface antigen
LENQQNRVELSPESRWKQLDIRILRKAARGRARHFSIPFVSSGEDTMTTITRRTRILAVALVPVLLAGCSGDGPNKQDAGLAVGAVAGGILGNQIGKGSGRVAATAIGAVIGGIVGSEVGRSMDQQDRMLAQQAEFDALERGQSGVVRQWKNPDNGRFGEVVPSRPYKRNAADCRDYTHKIYLDNGQPQVMRGTACRNQDGTWTNVT